MTIDDGLADLIAPHWSDGAGPRIGLSGSGADVQYGQGTVVEWGFDEAGVFHNLIRIDGTPIPDVPLMGSSDIFVTAPGDQVAVMYWTPSGGAGVYWITGRIVVPGTAAAARSIEFMRGNLAREISAEIFAGQVFGKGDTSGEITVERTSTSYGDPDSPGDIGPLVENVPIKSGTAIVFVSALVKFSTEDTASNGIASAGFAGFRISGATNRDPTDERSALAFGQKYRNGGTVTTVDGTSSWTSCAGMFVETGLNAGDHDFKMEYRRHELASEPGAFLLRNIVVIGL